MELIRRKSISYGHCSLFQGRMLFHLRGSMSFSQSICAVILMKKLMNGQTGIRARMLNFVPICNKVSARPKAKSRQINQMMVLEMMLFIIRTLSII